MQKHNIIIWPNWHFDDWCVMVQIMSFSNHVMQHDLSAAEHSLQRDEFVIL
jgi:hypothetical protein